ncbi:hypothetical protein EC988_005479, partial [Linderina pennispora]
MEAHGEAIKRRCKLRVNFVGVDEYDHEGRTQPYRKLIYIANSTDQVGDVRKGINTLFAKLYPDDG